MGFPVSPLGLFGASEHLPINARPRRSLLGIFPQRICRQSVPPSMAILGLAAKRLGGRGSGGCSGGVRAPRSYSRRGAEKKTPLFPGVSPRPQRPAPCAHRVVNSPRVVQVGAHGKQFAPLFFSLSMAAKMEAGPWPQIGKGLAPRPRKKKTQNSNLFAHFRVCIKNVCARLCTSFFLATPIPRWAFFHSAPCATPPPFWNVPIHAHVRQAQIW